uniref:Uncharacterized protein n=1 Tax=Anguilla anguilla TaxID=7936 RepID=A0A0E9QR47_ANGAN
MQKVQFTIPSYRGHLFQLGPANFLGITGRFILNFELHAVMVACESFKGRHTAENYFINMTILQPSTTLSTKRVLL